MEHKPEILAPAGDGPAALAALAAGADAIYLGLKHFSARMQAQNFGLGELARLVALAHARDRKVFVALNTLLKPADLADAGKLIAKLGRDVHPDALIMQDLGALEMARQAGFPGELHLSTLANLTHPVSLEAAHAVGAHRVILPRELNLDEIRTCAAACPPGMGLEFFVHGALCYCVSGRCWWSSYMGGKSGLRGRCVQPCRRYYQQKGKAATYFSCQDYSLDTLTKTLLDIPQVLSWKIEGRKKGPHYVFHTVAAYKLLRDHADDPAARQEAEGLLAMALGRTRSKSLFLPQKPRPPLDPSRPGGSGLLAGKLYLAGGPGGKPAFRPRLDLFPGDYLRVGSEDMPGHFTSGVPKPFREGEQFFLRPPQDASPRAGAPVFLIDRRLPDVEKRIEPWRRELEKLTVAQPGAVEFTPRLAAPAPRSRQVAQLTLRPSPPSGKPSGQEGLWLTPAMQKSLSTSAWRRFWWWLPPVIWPEEEAQWTRLINRAREGGARRFVLGSPWQARFFAEGGAHLVAGPFCNPANAAALMVYRELGIAEAIVSPELDRDDLLALPRQSPLPLGVVVAGWWPVGMSRLGLVGVKAEEPFTSPQGEVFWARQKGPNTWLYPGWPLDLGGFRDELVAAGYGLLVTMAEEPPRSLPPARRSSTFNYRHSLL